MKLVRGINLGELIVVFVMWQVGLLENDRWLWIALATSIGFGILDLALVIGGLILWSRRADGHPTRRDGSRAAAPTLNPDNRSRAKRRRRQRT